MLALALANRLLKISPFHKYHHGANNTELGKSSIPRLRDTVPGRFSPNPEIGLLPNSVLLGTFDETCSYSCAAGGRGVGREARLGSARLGR